VFGDTTGYDVAALNASVAAFKKDGAEIVYQANIDATQPDMAPDMLRLPTHRNACAYSEKWELIWSACPEPRAQPSTDARVCGGNLDHHL
jgi:hypothetical protein